MLFCLNNYIMIFTKYSIPFLFLCISTVFSLPLHIFSFDKPSKYTITYNSELPTKLIQQWIDTILNVNKNPENATMLLSDIYNIENVMFKPTKASKIPFRTDKDGLLSYFIGNNTNYPEDSGFALEKWTDIKFTNAGYIQNKNYIVIMGNYEFIHELTEKNVKAEYTFTFIKTYKKWKIISHHSSLPFK